MTQNGINSSENRAEPSGQTDAGKRCTVCTGCGRCGFKRRMRILTSSLLQRPRLNLANERGFRLVAADIGTTTIAMELLDAEGNKSADFACVNPQTVYGADVLSRIRAAEDPRTRGELQRMVWSTLEQGLRSFRKSLQPDERLALCIAGNTTMSYLLLGYDPAELGHAPFAVTHPGGVFGMHRCGDTDVPYAVLPGMSAFVGGDLTAGVLACGMRRSICVPQKLRELTLLVDLGTNGEIVLGNADGLLATATAAGSAFEGGANRGIWGADMVHMLAEIRRRGFCDETGLLAEPYFETGIRISDTLVKQEQIRAVQLAKGAIRAGIEILLREYAREHGISEDAAQESVGRVVLAGGFGYYMDAADAVTIGLLPEVFRHRTLAGGNTALAGAAMVGERFLRKLCKADENGEADFLPHSQDWNARVLNLAQEPDFEKLYLQYMDLQA